MLVCVFRYLVMAELKSQIQSLLFYESYKAFNVVLKRKLLAFERSILFFSTYAGASDWWLVNGTISYLSFAIRARRYF